MITLVSVIEGESMDVITKTSEKIQAIVDEVSYSSPNIFCLETAFLNLLEFKLDAGRLYFLDF